LIKLLTQFNSNLDVVGFELTSTGLLEAVKYLTGKDGSKDGTYVYDPTEEHNNTLVNKKYVCAFPVTFFIIFF
jgi:hypothetical protein